MLESAAKPIFRRYLAIGRAAGIVNKGECRLRGQGLAAESRMDVTLSPRARSIVIWVGVLAGGFVLFEASHALKPFAWAMITAYILHPLVARIHRRTRLPKQLVAAWLYVLLGLIFTILLINLTP